MHYTLDGLKMNKYNGLRVDLLPDNNSKEERACVRLPCGKAIRVPFHAVIPNKEIDTCSICALPLFPGYCVETACHHVFHTSCISKWRLTAKLNVEAAGTRCPLCRAYQGTTGLFSWKKSTAEEVVLMALGSICQNYARQNQLPEPSLQDELYFVLTCIQRCKQNGQNNYKYIQDCIDAYNHSPNPDAQLELIDALKRILIVHVFYDSQVDTKYTQAIDAWLVTLGRL